MFKKIFFLIFLVSQSVWADMGNLDIDAIADLELVSGAKKTVRITISSHFKDSIGFTWINKTKKEEVFPDLTKDNEIYEFAKNKYQDIRLVRYENLEFQITDKDGKYIRSEKKRTQVANDPFISIKDATYPKECLDYDKTWPTGLIEKTKIKLSEIKKITFYFKFTEEIKNKILPFIFENHIMTCSGKDLQLKLVERYMMGSEGPDFSDLWIYQDHLMELSSKYFQEIPKIKNKK